METRGTTHVNLSRRAGVIGPIGAVDLALHRLREVYAKKGMTLGQGACAEPKELWNAYVAEIDKARDEVAGVRPATAVAANAAV